MSAWEIREGKIRKGGINRKPTTPPPDGHPTGEGMVRKGGVGTKPTGPPPPPPAGQGEPAPQRIIVEIRVEGGHEPV